MRLRLGFLRRRSTESSLSARPPPEEAQKWSESFTALMASKCKLSASTTLHHRCFALSVRCQLAIAVTLDVTAHPL